MIWRKLNEEEQLRFRRGKAPPLGKAWVRSPCLVIVEIDAISNEASLLERLDDSHFENVNRSGVVHSSRWTSRCSWAHRLDV